MVYVLSWKRRGGGRAACLCAKEKLGEAKQNNDVEGLGDGVRSGPRSERLQWQPPGSSYCIEAQRKGGGVGSTRIDHGVFRTREPTAVTQNASTEG